jgi:hypothetical protein
MIEGSYAAVIDAGITYLVIVTTIGVGFVLGAWWAGRGD